VHEGNVVEPTVGVLVIGHGGSATALLSAARTILGPAAGALADVVAVDAGRGKTPDLERLVCTEIAAVDQGAGVLLLVDLLGASPCACGQQEARENGNRATVLSGLNLAMLLKLATVDRQGSTAAEVATACANTARRSVVVAGAPKAKQEP